MDEREKWMRYELEKKKIQELNLTPSEYEKRILELTRKLKV